MPGDLGSHTYNLYIYVFLASYNKLQKKSSSAKSHICNVCNGDLSKIGCLINLRICSFVLTEDIAEC